MSKANRGSVGCAGSCDMDRVVCAYTCALTMGRRQQDPSLTWVQGLTDLLRGLCCSHGLDTITSMAKLEITLHCCKISTTARRFTGGPTMEYLGFLNFHIKSERDNDYSLSSTESLHERTGWTPPQMGRLLQAFHRVKKPYGPTPTCTRATWITGEVLSRFRTASQRKHGAGMNYIYCQKGQ